MEHYDGDFMELLYGSQNFGYDIATSDKDYIRFIYPTLDTLLYEKITNKVIANPDIPEAQLLIKDVRVIRHLIEGNSFNSLQFMYSRETFNCEELHWFFYNRQALVMYDMAHLFNNSAGFIHSHLTKQPKNEDDKYKNYIRAVCFCELLESIYNGTFVNIYNPSLRERRVDKDYLEKEIITIPGRVESMKPWFLAKEKNFKLTAALNNEVKRLVKKHLDD